MTLSVWSVSSGHNLGTFNERNTINVQLPVVDEEDVTFRVISGRLPAGLRLQGSRLIGTPFEVSLTTEYKFVIRASKNNLISDRTFLISIEGSDDPTWLTPEGLLPVGSNDAYYVIDSSFIDFQLSAIDNDTAAGQNLNYFIASDEGELPPGLILLPNGRITGFIQPLLAVQENQDEGFYDSGLFDSIAYDFGYRSTNGYDTYVFDLTTYDFSVATRKPRKLNRNYEFIATITDGNTITKRKFRIYVVGDDFFRADNVIMKAGQGTYTADVTYVRAPIFTTPNYLGLRRANNYQTFKIDVFEGFTDLGPVAYSLVANNAFINGVCQRETANDNRQGSTFIRFEKSSGEPKVGYKINFLGDFAGADGRTYTITEVDPIGGDIYRVKVDTEISVTIPNGTSIFLGTESKLPPGMQFDPSTSEIIGIVPYQPATTHRYQFTIKATRFGQGTELSSSRRVFTVDILGEIDSVIKWNSDSDLGTIDTGSPSTIFVSAASTYSENLLYSKEEGDLPPGLNLNIDGEIVGTVTQLENSNVYKSFWKPAREYKKLDIVKQNNISQIKSLTRRKNTATVVTQEDHNFKNGSIVNTNSSILNFNTYNGIEITVDKLKINSVLSVEGAGPYRVKFALDTQKLSPLAPVFTLFKGLPISIDPGIYNDVGVKSTSGQGQGARFIIEKGNNGIEGNATYVGVTSAILLDPGTGYLPGDIITISGADLGGVDGVNDLTFVTSSGLEFYYKINGNSNSNYHGRFFAVSAKKEIVDNVLTETLVLNFDQDPGEFGSGLISVETSPGEYQAQTQITPANYFNYFSLAASSPMITATGNSRGEPIYYKATEDHLSDIEFDDTNWGIVDDIFEGRSDGYEESISRFDQNSTYFDDFTTTVDRTYTFVIQAKDSLGFSAITKKFSLRINIPNDLHYSNLYARPFMKIELRDKFKDFINDPQIFNPKLIYRLGDPNFGVQKDLKSLIFAGIETVEAVKYISAMGKNHKPKRFNLGEVKKAVAKIPGTNQEVYEVIYLELIDPLEIDKKHLPFVIKKNSSNVNITVDNTNQFYKNSSTIDTQHFKRPIPLNASIDRTDIFAGDPGTLYKFPSSISIWRKRIREIQGLSRERNYLPLWMRSIQPNQTTELDFIAAIPLCYCKVGYGSDILLNIKNSGFDFKLLNYTVDRYIIDSVDGYYQDKYLAFRNDRTAII